MKALSSLTALWVNLTKKTFVNDLVKGRFSSLRVLICCYDRFHYEVRPKPQQGLARVLSIGCPALRFLQIENRHLCADCPADWHDLFKRLFVLIVEHYDQGPIFNVGLFPDGCELRVLTIEYLETDLDSLLWLETLLNIIDICLPKLVHLNFVWSLVEHASLALVWDNYKSQFRQKSVNLVSICNFFK